MQEGMSLDVGDETETVAAIASSLGSLSLAGFYV
jgi:hypothetical protein